MDMSTAILKKMLPFVAALAMVACSKDDVQVMTPNATLQVKTESSGNDPSVSYPVQVYVFQGNECCALQTLGDADQMLSIALVEGTYTLYAIGGAAYTDYELPSQTDATPASVISLISGHSHGDLMTATATATLVDGGTNTVTLGMVRKVMLLQEVTISQVPTAATAVSVTIAPLWQNITLDGNYDGTGGSSTFDLARQGNSRTWTSSSEVYLLPPSNQPASISVNITADGITQSYTYSSSDELDAGYKITIEGTYNEAIGVTLAGTITGATWQGERTISFDFNSNGTSGGGSGGSGTSTLPAAGDTYLGCYVLSSEEATDGQSAVVTLLSPNEASCYPNGTSIDAALSSCSVDGVTGWAVPTKEQTQLIEPYLLVAEPSSRGKKYLYLKTTSVYGYRQFGSSDATSWPDAQSGTTYRLRPVAVMTVTAE